MTKQIIFILLVLLINFANCVAQTEEDFAVANDVFEQTKTEHKYKFSDYESKNELQSLAYGSFIFYKKFFSSQDLDACIFYPSCSVYTVESIKKNGLLEGLLSGIDRLQRCNRLAGDNYKKYKNTHFLHDPID